MIQDNTQLLKQYLIKYSKQIGILETEIPELYFNVQEFTTRLHESIDRRGIEIQQDTFDIDYFAGLFGYCGRRHGRYIFVNLDRYNDDNDLHHSDLRRLLVHELVHYRFPDLKHGTEFYYTIELIFSEGKKYPKVHIPCPNVPMI